MAAPPNRLRAHDCGRSGLIGKIEKALDAFVKLLRFHVVRITTKGSVSPGLIVRIRARFPPSPKFGKMFVANSALAQRLPKRLFIELRKSFRTWQTPDINDQVDSVFLEQRNE